MKYGKRAVLATALAAQALFYSSAAVPATPKKILTERYDCSGVAGLKLAPGELTVVLMDESAQPTGERIQKMRAPTCRSVYAAQRVPDSQFWLDRDWLNGLIFSAVNPTAGEAEGAELVQSRLRAPHHYVTVTTGFVDNTAPEAMVFTLSRELGHGLYRHETRTAALRLLSTAFYASSVLTFGMLPLTASVAASGAAFDAGLGVGTCVVASLNKRFEMQADSFGVRALETLGMPKDAARDVALGVLRAAPAEEGRCMDAHNASAGASARTQAVMSL